MSKERPILFTGEMVRAILAGKKTQTRRVIKPQPKWGNIPSMADDGTWALLSEVCQGGDFATNVIGKCPYGISGDSDWQGGMPPSDGYYYVQGFAGPIWLRRFLPEDYPGEDITPGLLWARDERGDPEAIEVEGLSLETIQWKRPGDRLWPRETWRISSLMPDDAPTIQYKADGAELEAISIDDVWDEDRYIAWHQRQSEHLTADCAKAGTEPDAEGIFRWTAETNPNRWHPSIFMPRWACRILLEVTGVRVERVQGITTRDIEAEGLPLPNWRADNITMGVTEALHREAFINLRDDINRARGFGWDTNPWVWVISFSIYGGERPRYD